MAYIENPKTKGSQIICCIPQTGTCPNKCPDCFFQSGRSYLEPLDKNLPNMPDSELAKEKIVRVNDGHDSNVHRKIVLEMIKQYDYKNFFFNTAIPLDIEGFQINEQMMPVVLTLNPSRFTDNSFHKLNPIPRNLMFVRFRINAWNLNIADEAIQYYTKAGIPVVLTFMAYYGETIPAKHKKSYNFKKRTLNSYWVINPKAWKKIVNKYKKNPLVLTCGMSANNHACKNCKNCEKEYWRTIKKLKK